MHRKLVISINVNDIINFNKLNDILKNSDLSNGFKERNILIEVKNTKTNNMKLYGYDANLKYNTNIITSEEIAKIFSIVDQMPLRKKEIMMNKLGGNLNLYTDDNPMTTIKNTGFKDEKKALQTIKIISKRSIIYQKTTINALYYRAKHHPNKTNDIKAAMIVFKKWLQDNKYNTIKYEYLDLDIIKKYEKLANYYDISHVARGLKKASKSDEGFLVVYKKNKGNKNKLPFIPIFKNKPNGLDYDIFREKFINSRIGQMKHANIKLYDKNGLPTKQHVILIMYAYSPDKQGVINKLKLLDKLGK